MSVPSPRVIIGIPAYGPLDPDTVGSLLGLIAHSAGTVVDVVIVPYMYIDQARNTIVRTVMGNLGPRLLGGYGPTDITTHLLFLDADMTWPKDTVARLLKHDAPVVGGLYFQKEAPFAPTAYTLHAGVVRKLDTIGTGTQPVDGMGLGCTLICMDLLRKIRGYFHDDRWFCSQECGEDVFFFRRLQTFGYSALLDQDLVCGHIGRQVVTDQHWRLYREFQGKQEIWR